MSDEKYMVSALKYRPQSWDSIVGQHNIAKPIQQAIPNRLQICKEYNIAFCGDWFDFEGFGRVEGAIISALKLSNKLNSLTY